MAEYRDNIREQVWEEAVVLFATFSRFEHAMKRSGFLNSSVVNAKAEANWDTFAQKLGTTFLDQCKSAPMLDEFFKDPPRLLKVSDTSVRTHKST
ncbi:MAG: hypothetical protein IE922_05285 [Sphingomonadales bacterium]|nr:hypothetical protein [Sphingomonadales bacterium]